MGALVEEALAPGSEADCAAIVREAAAEGQALEIRGGGSRSGLGHPIRNARTLSMARLSGVTLYEPEAMTLVAAAGTPLAEIETLLAGQNQRLPFEPTDLRALYDTGATEPTLGGVVATGASGPRRIQAGACRDSLIGVRFVNGRGEAIKSGGRVMKDVTGYDLVKLTAGAHGTLGVITQVAFKLLPRPEKTATLLLSRLSDEAAVAAMSAALGSPFDVTGAAHFPAGPDGAPVTMIRLEGFEKSVDYRAEKLREQLRPLLPSGAEAAIEAGAETTEADWRRVRDAEGFAGRPGAVWRITVKPSDGPGLLAELRAALPVEAAFYDWGGGLIWLLTADPAGGDAGGAAVRAATDTRGGKATLLRASEETRARVSVFHPQNPVLGRLAAGLKSKFDPAGVLNPGRMGA